MTRVGDGGPITVGGIEHGTGWYFTGDGTPPYVQIIEGATEEGRRELERRRASMTPGERYAANIKAAMAYVRRRYARGYPVIVTKHPAVGVALTRDREIPVDDPEFDPYSGDVEEIRYRERYVVAPATRDGDLEGIRVRREGEERPPLPYGARSRACERAARRATTRRRPR